MKRTWLLLVALTTFGLLSSCAGTRALLQTAPSRPKASGASPAIIAPDLAAWEAQVPSVQRALEETVYGVMPRDFSVETLLVRALPSAPFDAIAEEVTLRGAYDVQGSKSRSVDFRAVVLLPKNATGPVPLIMMENFCPNHAVIPAPGITKPGGTYFDCSNEGAMAGMFGYFFGRYITTPPIDMILSRGYGLAALYPPETFPDSDKAMGLYDLAPEAGARWGAIGAWAYQFSLLQSYFETDTRVAGTIAYGHSRYGKSALVAAAFDGRIDAVIAHQSGTGGASLSRGKPGETVAAITKTYPHWFTPRFAEFGPDQAALPVDQHHLLALIAPRPLLLGNARRDVWSDPEGGFRAALGAAPAYQVYGKRGLSASRLSDFRPDDDIAFWIRPGTHGVVKEDWPAFLEFLDAHFK